MVTWGINEHFSLNWNYSCMSNDKMLFLFSQLVAVFGGFAACVVIGLLLILYMPVGVCNKILLFLFS